eukprot:360252-Chlamydomonas_euryale.AAC.7
MMLPRHTRGAFALVARAPIACSGGGCSGGTSGTVVAAFASARTATWSPAAAAAAVTAAANMPWSAHEWGRCFGTDAAHADAVDCVVVGAGEGTPAHAYMHAWVWA